MSEEIREPGEVEATFSIEKMAINLKDNYPIWTMQMVVYSRLNRIYTKYRIVLELNQEDFDRRIREQKQSLNGTLFGEEKVTKEQVDKNILAIEKELKEAMKKYKEIEFIAATQGFSRSGSIVVFKFYIGDYEDINELNNFHLELSKYKARLIPID